MQKLGDIFIATGLINEEDLGKALKEKERNPALSIAEILITLGLTTDKAIAEALSTHLNLPLVELGNLNVENEVLEKFTVKLANKFMVFPLEKLGKTIKLAMANPLDFDAIQAVEFKLACNISPVVSTYTSIRSIIERYYGLEEDIEEIIKDARYDQGPELIEETPDPTVNILKREGQSSPIVRIVNKVLQKAVKMNASDIHLEPQETDIQVRYRIDGIMNEVMQLPKKMLNGMVSRIKITASLDIAERRLPQDGSFKMSLEGRAYEIRVSTLPTKFGEKVVMRLLNASNPTVWLDEVGFLPSAIKTVFHFAHLKQGIVLATGPTGAGKTTTLYSFIKELLQRKLNIITFEDPIEYQIQGVNQVQINQKKGLTFASGLRSALRQDPDVIMVGEIRDVETLKVALQAAMTGHLVLSTVHTNDATSTIFRLKNIGAENFQISGGLAGVIAQRLIRTICTNCKDIYKPSEQIIERIAAKLGQSDFPYVFYKGKGCEKCSSTGYRGRLGVYEVLNIDSTMQALIVDDVAETQLREKAIENGMITMARDCIEKLRYGLTTVEELERVFVLEAKTSEKCPSCQRSLNQKFSICPYCSYILLSVCFNCNKEMDPEWTICPYCRSEKGSVMPMQKALPYGGTKYLTNSLSQQRYLGTGEHKQLALPPSDEFEEYNSHIEFSSPNYKNSSQQYAKNAFSSDSSLPNEPKGFQSNNFTPANQQFSQQFNQQPNITLPNNLHTPSGNFSNQPPLDQNPSFFDQPQKPIEEKFEHNILVVEGDEILLIGLETYLKKENFNVRVAKDGLQALEQMLSFSPQLVVVDTMTLRMDGYEFIRSLRQGTSSFLPIIILSTKDSIEDKILGFTLGIDDYLDKPFSSEELTSRIRTVLRRVYG
ncbi:MAG: Flp pilus assembly complex ATPase component TadA [Acidobacteria bacterium]|nr:Flp pilus assembly complex ATPase component TadA [Acidobacteriota bacterium]